MPHDPMCCHVLPCAASMQRFGWSEAKRVEHMSGRRGRVRFVTGLSQRRQKGACIFAKIISFPSWACFGDPDRVGRRISLASPETE